MKNKKKSDCKVIDFEAARHRLHVGRLLSYFAVIEKEYIIFKLKELEDKLYNRRTNIDG